MLPLRTGKGVMAELRETFNEVAELYDAVRPGYPAGLYDDVQSLAGLRPEDRVLEVGCGTGQATRDFSSRGLRVLGLDPGPQLIAVARRRFEGVPGVEFVVSRFEDFDPEPGAFRLVAAAQSWHWVPQEAGFRNAARALAPDGSLAVFGHVPGPLPEDVEAALEPVYRRHAPELWAPSPQTWYLPQGPVKALFEASGLFGQVTHRSYVTKRSFTPQSVVRELRTHSEYNVVPAERREPLLAEVETTLAAGWYDIEIQNETHLYLAPRR